MLKICVLASSSSGNCTFVGSDRTRILIDAGLSRKEAFERLAAIGESWEKLDAVLITHEHSDHISGLGPIGRKLQKPVFLTKLTAPLLDWNGLAAPPIEPFQAGTSWTIGDLDIQSFTIPHDAVDPVGFTVRHAGVKFGLAMDLGYLPDSVKFHLRGSHALVMESNHDLEMLKVGPYPWSVKQRVMGRKGHLSNDVVGEFISSDLDSETQHLLLGHLSEHNNHPEIVRLVASMALERSCLPARLTIAEPKRQSEVFHLG
ncbi:MAG: MBL fold metallo-hydrolase [Bryobacteraceae bacterium]